MSDTSALAAGTCELDYDNTVMCVSNSYDPGYYLSSRAYYYSEYQYAFQCRQVLDGHIYNQSMYGLVCENGGCLIDINTGKPAGPEKSYLRSGHVRPIITLKVNSIDTSNANENSEKDAYTWNLK